MHKFNREKLQQKLLSLSDWKKVAFGLSICERLYPNYVAFAEETGCGSASEMRSYIDMVRDSLRNDAPIVDAESAEKKSLTFAPDTEDFSSYYTSVALDTAVSVATLIAYQNDHEMDKLVDIAEAAYDTVSLFLSQVDCPYEIDEQWILTHPMMQNELEKQREELELLDDLGGSFADNQAQLLARWKTDTPLSVNVLD